MESSPPFEVFDVAVLTHSLEEAAALLPCNPRWLADQIRAGRFSARKIAGHWRMTEDDIEHALDKCRNTSQHSADRGVTFTADENDSGLTSTSRRRLKKECRRHYEADGATSDREH